MAAISASEARRVTTVVEAREILESGRFTFEEALDAARVARIAEDWELLERAAVAALGAVGRRSLPNRTLLEAAELVAIAHFKWILSLEESGRALQRAVAVLSDLKTKVSGAAEDVIGEELQWLNEVMLLVGDQDEASLVSLCARLRRLDRADLGREAATRALTVNPSNAQALTTRGAAAVDDFLLDAAAEDLEAAWALEPTAYVANAMSRLALAAGRSDDALSWAETAVNLDPSDVSWSVLAAAAKASGRDQILSRALMELESTPSQGSLFQDGLSRFWPTYLAGRALARAGRFDEAEAIADSFGSAGYAMADALWREIAIWRRKKGSGG